MAPPHIIRVSVLKTGELLLDGRPATLSEIELALKEGAQAGAAVWYYREDPGSQEPPAGAMSVMKLIVENRLPVRLCTKPDFSGDVSTEASGLETLFAGIREKAARQIVILRPDGKVMMMPSMDPARTPPAAGAAVERMMPSTVKRKVAVIADTAWTLAAAPTLVTANQAIPFFGLLMGLASIGHAVWIFDAAAVPALVAGCRSADVVIVDSERLASLPSGWHAAVRGPQILIHDRVSYQLRKFEPPG